MNVRERADAVATMRYVAVFMMETLARWVPTTPTMEVKVLFGRHIWEFAQHADVLGRRTWELRLPKHHSIPPTADYQDLLTELNGTDPEAMRMSAVYDVMLPAISRRCETYIAATDEMLDEPSVRIMRRIRQDCESMIGEADALRREHSQLSIVDAEWRQNLIDKESSVDDIVVPRISREASNG